MLLICLCLVIFDAVFVVDANYCSCKGQDLAKGGEDCRVDDSHRWYEEGGCDEEDTEADEQNGKKNLMLHWRCEGVKVLRRLRLLRCSLALHRTMLKTRLNARP